MINDLKLESEQLDKLIKARIEFDRTILENPIGKDAKGNRGAYLSLENLQEKTIDIMAPLGLTIKQTTIVDNGNEYLVTTLRHESGQYERSVAYLFKHEPVMDGELAKLAGSLMTYAQRYQWRAMLSIGRGSEDIEDIDTSRQPKAYQKPYQQPKPEPVVQQKSVLKISKEQKNNIVTLTNRHNGLLEALCKTMDVSIIDDLEQQNYKIALDTADKMVNMLD